MLSTSADTFPVDGWVANQGRYGHSAYHRSWYQLWHQHQDHSELAWALDQGELNALMDITGISPTVTVSRINLHRRDMPRSRTVEELRYPFGYP